MAFSVETTNRLKASLRGYLQFAAGAFTTMMLVTASHDSAVGSAITQIYTGVTMIFHGGVSLWNIFGTASGGVASYFLARWSSQTARVISQAQAVRDAVEDPKTPIDPATKIAIVDSAHNLKQQ